MKINLLLAVLLVLLLCAGIAGFEDWAPLDERQFHSPKKKHVLTVEPERDWWEKPGHCKATLYELDKDGKFTVWSRHLINNHGPVDVFVADSGKYVVTLDEWGSVGELPVVIYGQRGELIRAHSTDSLRLKEDRDHIELTIPSYGWSKDSISFFGPDEKFFLIRLHWGKFIILNLDTGDLIEKPSGEDDDRKAAKVNQWHALSKFARKKAEQLAVQMLDSESAGERETGAKIVGQYKTRSAIPKLKEL